MNGTVHSNLQARGRLYRLLAEPFRFPERQAAEKFCGEWGVNVCNAMRPLGLCPPEPVRLEEDFEQFQVAFIDLFEVGLGGAPCPLHSGYYARDRMLDLEEVVRFYRYFGFETQRTPDRFPDHLVFEFEFMAHLVEAGESRRAQRDFLERHLANWLPRLRTAVEPRSATSFIIRAVHLTDDYVRTERHRLAGESS